MPRRRTRGGNKNEGKENKETNRINRKELIKALDLLKPGSSAKTEAGQSNFLIITKNYLMRHNYEIAIRYPFPIGIGFTGGISEKEFSDLLQKLPSDDIIISEEKTKEGNRRQLIIQCENIKSGLYIDEEVIIPELGIDEVDEWAELPKEFISGIKFCLPSTSSDSTGGILTCLHIEDETIFACDNIQVSKYSLEKGLLNDAILNIPKNAAKHLEKYEPLKVSVNNKAWIHFENKEGLTFSTRTLDQKFLDVQDLFNNSNGKKITFPKELKKAISHAEIFSSEGGYINNVAKVKIEAGNIIISGKGLAGWLVETMPIDSESNIPEFAISPSTLYRILDSVQEGILTESSLLFQGDKFSHVIALID